MSKEEILEGIKQAVARGHNLEKVKQSFINAGFNAREVDEAAGELSELSYKKLQLQPQAEEVYRKQQNQQINQFSPEKQLQQQAFPQNTAQQPPKIKPLPQLQQQKPKKSKIKLIILIIVLIIIFLILLISLIA